MIIAGVEEVKGSDHAQVLGAIRAHQDNPVRAASITLSLVEEDAGSLRLTATAPGPLHYATDIHLVRYTDRAQVEILAGENQGRKITYRNIVTSWDLLAKWDGVAPLRERIARDGSDGIVVIVQEQGYGPILGAVRWR